MKSHLLAVCRLVMVWLLLWPFPQEARAFLIKNGDFEAGDLSGWTTYETAGGTVGGATFPACVDFDVKGNGHATMSAEFKVGLRRYDEKGESLGGGGIFRNLELREGKIALTVEIATSYSSPKDKRNLAGGLFELLLDGSVIASHDFGPINNGDTQRFTLTGTSQILSGHHEIRVRIRRPFRSLPRDTSPRQYIDNLQLSFLPQ